MDTVADQPGTDTPTLSRERPDLRPALPEENPLSMPIQSLSKWSRAEERSWIHPALHHGSWAIRLFVFGGMVLLTAFGAWEMYKVVEVGGVTLLEWALVCLFVLNFSWIALAFTAAIAGFVYLLFHRRITQPLPPQLASRTAVLMPIYNEAPSRVFAAMQAIIESVEQTGLGKAFDYFFVSDTTDPNVWIAEERAFVAMRERLGPNVALWYRHRQRNTNRKAGNIADWVTRWGGSYDHMLVLDADSLMTGSAITQLAAAMERDPDAGIIQTLPLIINRNTLFARIQQFAARVYGPVIAEGLSLWMGHDGNYWGHNAIIRTKAFAAHCGMPDLSGKPPFGGHILSHDFVEAALIRRAGYAVYMLNDVTGSYEESPPSLIDLSARDRRWCQGNLQHTRVMGAKGFHPCTRQHFANGIFSYLASPLWLLQLLVGLTIALQAHFIRREYFTDEFSLFPAWPVFNAELALALFGGTMGILLAPKFFGIIIMLLDGPNRRASGGGIRLVLSGLIEIFLSALLAPVMMLIQSGSVFEILVGRDSGWKPQRRDDGSIPFRDIVKRHRSHTILGLFAGVAAYVISPYLFTWMSPTIIGLLLAIPLSWASGQLSIGLWLRRHGFLATPEETHPPEVATRANALSEELAAAGEDDSDAIEVVYHDADFRALHETMLPTAPLRERGRFEQDRVMAQAKIAEAVSIEEAVKWLNPKERFVALHDHSLIESLSRLHEQTTAQEPA
ncbi:glucans biosynthesis glucosyltransferase H [Labrys miyagiensis]|uniref:Glucans biosynthesis glucosyltransferase H n=1 Tax=Labrys miyagiensis TaxID=346912 RepID=A0ABQ6CHB1_9HYPH|nr:glucans biosynthesis glucosyltransferase MdoH [Labrys miyagiensis]GLS19012.1 glucans biosynthesis glucosyltransferase H [Labrys miyagiensis]